MDINNRTHKKHILDDGSIYWALIVRPNTGHMFKGTKKQINRTNRMRRK